MTQNEYDLIEEILQANHRATLAYRRARQEHGKTQANWLKIARTHMETASRFSGIIIKDPSK